MIYYSFNHITVILTTNYYHCVLCVCIYVCIYIYICVYIYICIHICDVCTYCRMYGQKCTLHVARVACTSSGSGSFINSNISAKYTRRKNRAWFSNSGRNRKSSTEIMSLFGPPLEKHMSLYNLWKCSYPPFDQHWTSQKKSTGSGQRTLGWNG